MSGAGARILIIEDSPATRRFLSRQLKRAGFGVEEASTGARGWTMILETRPRLVILDLHLPDQDGEELLSRLRRDPETAHMPVLVLTGRRSRGQERRCLEAGASGYLDKESHDLAAVPLHVGNLLRRNGGAGERGVTLGPLVFDFPSSQAFVDGRPLKLRAKEFELLLCVSRAYPGLAGWREIHKVVWDLPDGEIPDKSSPRLDSTLFHLRGKLKRLRGVRLETLKGRGIALRLS